jgi:hypothetical protein
MSISKFFGNSKKSTTKTKQKAQVQHTQTNWQCFLGAEVRLFLCKDDWTKLDFMMNNKSLSITKRKQTGLTVSKLEHEVLSSTKYQMICFRQLALLYTCWIRMIVACKFLAG